MATDNLQMALYRISKVEEELRTVKGELETIEQRNLDRDRERQMLERKQLLYGVTFLGGIIMTLGSVIWSYRGVIFKGLS